MLSKSHIKYIHSLRIKKFRVEQNSFVAEGSKTFLELLKSTFNIQSVYATADFIQNFSSRSQEGFFKLDKSKFVEVEENELKKISNLTTPNEVLVIAEIPKYEFSSEQILNQLNLVLDDISDPGNLGTIIRIADWFGIKNIICSPNTVDLYSPKVVQATMGSITRVQVHYTDLGELFKGLQNNIPIYGALLEGENIYKKKLVDKGLILIGNESRGISEQLLPYITDKITIPWFSSDNVKVESLNAAIACAIICSELRRGS